MQEIAAGISPQSTHLTLLLGQLFPFILWLSAGALKCRRRLFPDSSPRRSASHGSTLCALTPTYLFVHLVFVCLFVYSKEGFIRTSPLCYCLTKYVILQWIHLFVLPLNHLDNQSWSLFRSIN